MDRALAILVVDDDEVSARTLQTSFEIQGHRVVRAADALEALEAAQARVPDAAVIDIGLPGISGLTLAKLIRAEAATRNICLVALGASAEPASLAASLEAGFDAHVARPVTTAFLLNHIRARIAARQSRIEAERRQAPALGATPPTAETGLARPLQMRH